MTHWVPIYGSGPHRYLRPGPWDPTKGADPTRGAGTLRPTTRPAGSVCSLLVFLRTNPSCRSKPFSLPQICRIVASWSIWKLLPLSLASKPVSASHSVIRLLFQMWSSCYRVGKISPGPCALRLALNARRPHNRFAFDVGIKLYLCGNCSWNFCLATRSSSKIAFMRFRSRNDTRFPY